jgi:hypothetical protein
MQISGLAAGLSTLIPGGTRISSDDDSAPIVAAEAPAGEAYAATALDIRELLEGYDFSAISPRDLASLATKLHQQGAIDDAELQELNQLRFELEKRRTGPDQPVDLVEFVKQLLDERQQLAAENSDASQADRLASLVALGERQRDWIEKFQVLRDPAGSPFDATA